MKCQKIMHTSDRGLYEAAYGIHTQEAAICGAKAQTWSDCLSRCVHLRTSDSCNKRKLGDALIWIERGIAIERSQPLCLSGDTVFATI